MYVWLQGYSELLPCLQVRGALLREAIPQGLAMMWRALRDYDRDELNSLFADPVSKKDYPSYHAHIEDPMDLKTLGLGSFDCDIQSHSCC